MASAESEIRGLLNLGSKIAKKKGEVKAAFINGQLYTDALVFEADGFTFKARGANVEIVFNKDPFVSRSGKQIIRFHYQRYNAKVKVAEIAAQVGVKATK